jgi:hypothetical protein
MYLAADNINENQAEEGDNDVQESDWLSELRMQHNPQDM